MATTKQSITTVTLLVMASLLAGRCGDKFMSSKVKNEAKGSLELAATADAAGNYTGAIDPNSSATQVLRATSGELSGSAVAFPPGALGISLNVTIGSGETLASGDTTQQLGLGDNTASAAGPAVSFVPSQNVQASNPFTLSIPVSSTSLALSAADSDNLVVMYKWMKVDNGVVSYAIGIIPRDSLTVGSKTVQFQTTKFGTFQLAVTATKITEPVSKPTTEPPILKADASNPLVGVWSQCEANDSYSSSSTTTTSGTSTTLPPPEPTSTVDCPVSTSPYPFFAFNVTVSGTLPAGGYLAQALINGQTAASPLDISAGGLIYYNLTNSSVSGNVVKLALPNGCYFQNATGEKYMNDFFFNSCQRTSPNVTCDGTTIAPPPSTTTASTSTTNYGGGRDHIGIPSDAKTFSREYVKFSTSTFIHSRSTFTDANCTGTLISRVEETGSYKLGALNADLSYPISITFGGSMATILTAPAVNFANTYPNMGGCGYSDWILGTARDISGSICQKDDKGSSGPTLVKVQGSNIYFNDKGSATVNANDSMTKSQ